MTWLNAQHQTCPTCRGNVDVPPAPIAGHSLRYVYNWLNYRYARLSRPMRLVARLLSGLVITVVIDNQAALIGALARCVLPTSITTRAAQYFSRQRFEDTRSSANRDIQSLTLVGAFMGNANPALWPCFLRVLIARPYSFASVASSCLGVCSAVLTHPISMFATQQLATPVQLAMNGLFPTDNHFSNLVSQQTACTITSILCRLAGDCVTTFFSGS